MSSQSGQVPVNIYSADGKVMVAALMPGLQPDDITIEVRADGQVALRSVVRGQLKGWKEIHHEEWQAGGAERVLGLPGPVDGAGGHATYENGVLVVMLPASDSLTPGQFSPRAGQGH